MPDRSQHEPQGLNPGELFARALEGIRGAGGHGAWVPLTVEELQPQLPDYEILGLVGRGGMGAVYQARQRSLDRLVALKVLPPGIDSGDVQYRERFKREARAMAQLKHPGIVAVYDAGETPGGLLYFVMEFVAGADVGLRLAGPGRVPPDEALRIAAKICDALAYAHERGVVHRDIKPSNVMLEADGTVKVADFGLAKVATAAADGLTRSDLAFGSPDFVAPESLIPGMEVDGRADVYAVGVMLYQMLTGKIPRGHFDPPSGVVEGVDPRLDAIVLKAMKADREKRYATATEMRTALEAILAREVPIAHGAGKSSRTLPLLTAAAIVVGLGLGGWIVWKRQLPPAPRADTTSAAHPRLNPVAAVTYPEHSPDRRVPNAPVPALPPREWIAVDFASAPTNEKAGFQGSQMHVSGGRWWPLGPKRLRHSAQRITFVWRENTANVKLNTGDESATVHFGKLGVSRSGGQFWEIGHYPGRDVHLKGAAWDIEPPLKPGETVVFQFATLGDRHFVWLNGSLVGSTDHPAAPEGGVLTIHADELLLDRYEYMDLDGLPEAEALKLLGLPAPSPAWQRLDFSKMDAADLRDGKTYSGKEGDTFHLARDEMRFAPGPSVRNGAVRATVRWNAQTRIPRVLTRVADGKQYAFRFWVDAVEFSFYSGEDHMVKRFRPSAPPKDGDAVVLQLASIGRQHFVWVDGRLIGSVEDANLAGHGSLGIQANNAWYESMEWLPLDGLGEAEALKLLGIPQS